MVCAFWALMNNCLHEGHENFSLFYFRSFVLFSYNTHGIDFYISCRIEVIIHFFLCGYPITSALFIKIYSFPCTLLYFVIKLVTTHGLFQPILFQSLYLSLYHHCLNCGKSWYLVCSLRLLWPFWAFTLPYTLESSIPTYTQNLLIYGGDWIKSIDDFGQNW